MTLTMGSPMGKMFVGIYCTKKETGNKFSNPNLQFILSPFPRTNAILVFCTCHFTYNAAQTRKEVANNYFHIRLHTILSMKKNEEKSKTQARIIISSEIEFAIFMYDAGAKESKSISNIL